MSLTKKDLEAIGAIIESKIGSLESKIDGLEKDVQYIKVVQLENNVLPRLEHIGQCYLDTSNRYTTSADRFDNALNDIAVMKIAIQKNSSDIRELQIKQA